MMSMDHSIGEPGGQVEGRALPIIGWDIGGVNTKAVRWPGLEVRSAPYELQYDLAALAPTLRQMAGELGCEPGWAHAVTMTAELSQAFRCKREGVACVLDAVEQAFPGADIAVYAVSGEYITPIRARQQPLLVAAANWAATAALVGRSAPDCILVDIGTTSTDIIPVVGGRSAAMGWTDPDRLASGELVYTGAVRTPTEAIVPTVPLRGAPCAVSAEGFALIGDAHLWLGRLRADDYSVRPPDGRPATREFAGERLARVVCADREMLDDAAIDEIARALVEAQVSTVAGAISRVRQRHPTITTAVVTGLGESIAAEAAWRSGLAVTRLADGWARRPTPRRPPRWRACWPISAATVPDEGRRHRWPDCREGRWGASHPRGRTGRHGEGDC
jgi:(4-(4-[2-(gamma-L-glutamylamino)ethyl]phenoxymethyl)furan-2-yl)methanamine synthase